MLEFLVRKHVKNHLIHHFKKSAKVLDFESQLGYNVKAKQTNLCYITLLCDIQPHINWFKRFISTNCGESYADIRRCIYVRNY